MRVHLGLKRKEEEEPDPSKLTRKKWLGSSTRSSSAPSIEKHGKNQLACQKQNSASEAEFSVRRVNVAKNPNNTPMKISFCNMAIGVDP